ncbi:MAG: hypothetical protein JNK05_16860 [Myxococcales bacterium]|nr:hypothetical protein [Myxococcales bacterium]
MRRRTPLVIGCAALFVLASSPSLLFGSIEEQRARLPPAAEQDAGADCSDPATGVWLGQQYNQRSRTWQRYRLDIRRRAPGAAELVGTVRVHFWAGWYSHSTPVTACEGAGQLAAEVTQNATGRADGVSLAFGGNDWRTTQVFCQPPGTAVSYNPDRFTGSIDPSIQEFQSVNNDGGSAVNEPVVFRRIECASAPRPVVVIQSPAAPPPPMPWGRGRSSRFGCSR